MHSPSSRSAGFTLLELMIVVAIIAILAMIALPSYSDYLKRGNIVDATNQLTSYRAQMEQYYQDSRKYTTYTSGSNTFTSPCDGVANSNNTKWQYTCSTTATTYTITATGIGPMAGWVFTIDQNNLPTTTAGTGWTSSTSKFCLNKSCT